MKIVSSLLAVIGGIAVVGWVASKLESSTGASKQQTPGLTIQHQQQQSGAPITLAACGPTIGKYCLGDIIGTLQPTEDSPFGTSTRNQSSSAVSPGAVSPYGTSVLETLSQVGVA